MPLKRIVVVGNGIAGLTAGDSLRAAGFDGELTIVGDEHHAPYSRPALSKAALMDSEDMTSHQLPASTHEAREILGVSATRLDADRKVVHFDDGGDLPFDALVIATRLPGTPPRHRRQRGRRDGELTLRNVEDALTLRRRLANRPSVVVIGGGALGMEIASGCLSAGCEVTLASHDRPLTRQLGPYLSDVFLAAAAGADSGSRRPARSNCAARGRSASGRTLVVLADGSSIEADLVVSAVGDAPNTEWLASSGLLYQRPA